MTQKVPNGAKRLDWIQVSDLRISPRAQRDHSLRGAQALIEEIAANFDPDKFGTLVVNERDGTYWVVDGGHRFTALLRMGYEDQQVECWIYHELSEKSEAELFLDLNNVRPVSARDKFKVAVVAGRETECDIDRIVRSLDLTVGGGGGHGVGCVTALLKVYEQGGPAVLTTTLRVIKNAYGRPGFSARVTEGLGLFVANYENTFNETRLTTKLERKLGGVNGLLGRSEQIRSSHGVPGPVAIAAAAVETYNQGRGGIKLNGWWATFEQRETA